MIIGITDTTYSFITQAVLMDLAGEMRVKRITAQ